ncbi:MAG: energy-coupling factor transporter transmembrane protein EcfT [Anaerolineae bacterium]|nr:energy-coupling factor transporter transmembrane protein EcfT [Anaerolineae bacterium]
MALRTVDRDSLFTRLDFRPKLFMIAVITVVAFVWEDPLMGGGLALTVLLACLAAGVRPGYIRTVLLLMLPFSLILILTQGFFSGALLTNLTGLQPDSFHMLFVFPAAWPLIGSAGLSWEGVQYALNIIAKSLTMTLVIPLGIFTTDVDTMIVGMVKARIPYKIAFVFSSTLRFFPLLFARTQAIIEAQRLRGLAFETMGPVKRLRVYARIVVPLILSALNESQMLDVVLQSRAFDGSPDRTYLHDSRLMAADYALFGLFGLFLLTAIIGYVVFGVGKFTGVLW